jgi:hypothetical protein
MRFKGCTIGHVKSIYKLKIAAMETKDDAKIESLKQEYPEIFDAKFLMDILKNEFFRDRNGLDDTMIFKMELFQYH